MTADFKPPRRSPKGDYQIGYGRPPVATRFRSGGVGNPKGRPKGKKSVGQVIHEAMMTPVRIEVNGRSKTVTAQEVIVRNLVHSAARGDTRAIHALFGLKARYQDSTETTLMPSELESSDRQIIEEYLAKIANAKGEDSGQALVSENTQSTSSAASNDLKE